VVFLFSLSSTSVLFVSPLVKQMPQANCSNHVRAILSDLARSATDGVAGAVLGCSLRGDRHIVVHNNPGYKAVDSSSVFNVGSITKAITGTLLAVMVESGEVTLKESVRDVIGDPDLPEIWSVITLMDLATHRSGLSRFPPNAFGPPWQPYKGWDQGQLYAAMKWPLYNIELGRTNYSDFGIAVLAEALCQKACSPYDDLIDERIRKPLGLGYLSRESRRHPSSRATGYTVCGKLVPNWEFEAMMGAGGLLSPLDDLLSLAEANLGLRTTPLDRALQMSMFPPSSLPRRGRFGLCWSIIELKNSSVVWASGGLTGFASYIAIHLRSKVALVALLNSGRAEGLVKTAFTAFSKLCLL
jgi:serine-type D-Ala-D-Ala carboxypeptidase/endopeptidase